MLEKEGKGMEFRRPKNKYQLIIAGKKISRRMLYNVSSTETMLDAYWAFAFGNASSVKVLSIRKGRKVFKTFNSLTEWETEWVNLFGPCANYFVFANRH